MKYSIAFASIALGLLGTACIGSTKIGEGGEGGVGGIKNEGGAEPVGGKANHGGSATFGGAPGAAGSAGAGNAAASGGEAGAGTPACVEDADCPEVELCAPCSDGSCAELKCLSGACRFTCEPGGGSGGADGGACSVQGASCAAGETCCAGLECCAGVPVPPGNEYCGAVCPISDENLKRDFMTVDPEQILEKLSSLPVGTWAYRTEGSTERHIGPMAQDFKAAFQVGSSDRTILQVDADGVAFAAIQALNARLKAVEEQNQKLRSDLDSVR